MAQNVVIRNFRGPLANMPVLDDGVFYLTTDTLQLYVGLGGVNYSLGAPLMGIVQVQGNANPTRYIEPNIDGSVNVILEAGASVSLGTSLGKTLVMKTGQLVTTTVPQQTVLTYTVSAGKTFYVEYLDIAVRLTAVSATASVLGSAVIQIAGVTVYTGTFVNPTTSDCGSQTIRFVFTEPLPLAAATIIAVLATPTAVTSMTWTANFGGYEK